MFTSAAIIIPSLNSPLVDRVVRAVLAQGRGEQVQEIVVVGLDQAGLLAGILEPRLRFLDSGQPILAAEARNRGIRATTADLLIFLDSDCLPQPGWLAGHLAAHEEGHPVVSGGVLPAGSNYWHLVYNLTLFHQVLSSNPPGPKAFLATLNLSVEREVIARVGEMDPNINRVEDVDWTTRMRRAGIQPYFWPEASVRHEHSRNNLRRTWRDCALSGYHMRRLRLQHRDLLQAPGLLRYPRLLWLLSPAVAAWATLRIIWQRPRLALRYWHAFPAIYLTKIAWCWGASRPREPH